MHPQVKFVSDGSTEESVDDGGPTRELFRLVLEEWTSNFSQVLEGM